MIQQYVDKKVAIVCNTSEESQKINDLIVQHGGRNLHDKFGGGPHYYGMEHIGRKQNCHTDSDYYIKTPNEYLVIPASEILSPIYQIF